MKAFKAFTITIITLIFDRAIGSTAILMSPTVRNLDFCTKTRILFRDATRSSLIFWNSLGLLRFELYNSKNFFLKIDSLMYLRCFFNLVPRRLLTSRIILAWVWWIKLCNFQYTIVWIQEICCSKTNNWQNLKRLNPENYSWIVAVGPSLQDGWHSLSCKTKHTL